MRAGSRPRASRAATSSASARIALGRHQRAQRTGCVGVLRKPAAGRPNRAMLRRRLALVLKIGEQLRNRVRHAALASSPFAAVLRNAGTGETEALLGLSG